jgi:DNA-binding NtrC family response regulator
MEENHRKSARHSRRHRNLDLIYETEEGRLEINDIESRISALRRTASRLKDEIESLPIGEALGPATGSLVEKLRKFEINLICSALSKTAGSQNKAAKLLGINPTTLHEKIKRLRIDPKLYSVPLEDDKR